jgi:hypothetical protein
VRGRFQQNGPNRMAKVDTFDRLNYRTRIQRRAGCGCLWQPGYFLRVGSLPRAVCCHELLLENPPAEPLACLRASHQCHA